MIELNGIQWYSPREIADDKMIVNNKGKGDYNFVLRLIRNKELIASRLNENKKITYYVVAEEEIKRYNSNRFSVE